MTYLLLDCDEKRGLGDKLLYVDRADPSNGKSGNDRGSMPPPETHRSRVTTFAALPLRSTTQLNFVHFYYIIEKESTIRSALKNI